MAEDIQFQYVTGATLYAIIRDVDGDVWNGSVFEVYDTSNLGTYDIPLSEQGTASGYYTASWPGIDETVDSDSPLSVVVFQQLGASPAETDLHLGGANVWHIGDAIRNVASGPRVLKRPLTSYEDHEFYLNCYDAAGNDLAPDSTPTVTAFSHTGANKSGNLHAVVAIAAGRYKVDYMVTASAIEEQIILTWAIVHNGVTHHVVICFIVTDFIKTTYVPDVNIQSIDGSVTAATALRVFYNDVVTQGSVNDATPNSLSFDTTLTDADTFHDDAAIVFVEGILKGQVRRIETYLSNNVTVAKAFLQSPTDGDDFFVLGRIV